jgi:FkbH-like protein
MKNDLYWLPAPTSFETAFRAIKSDTASYAEKLQPMQALANTNLDFIQTVKLDRLLQSLQLTEAGLPPARMVKVALLGSSTIDHIVPALRVGALRRGLVLQCYISDYNQYRQEILDPASGLHAFRPEITILMPENPEMALKPDLRTPAAEVEDQVAKWVSDLAALWQILVHKTGSVVVQWNAVVPPWGIFGHHDSLVAASPRNISILYNDVLRRQAGASSVQLFDVESLAAYVGKDLWCDLPLWHHAKQAMPPNLAPLLGDHMARQIAALRGLSRKCLVLDLDNTLWGGVIGDDGLDGIVLGQGSGVGEAFSFFQAYVQQLRRRGIILGVCSKNEESNAWAPFDRHPEMILRRDDIALFIANWVDKPANLIDLAKRLNIGLDSLVFFDDNPAERDLVRRTLPQVAIPEVPEDPAWYVSCLADAGYFEAISFTADDALRTEQYQLNAKRIEQSGSHTNIESFLASLSMEMTVAPFNEVDLPRIVQLINKSNQFNLTTRRYTEAQVRQLMQDPSCATLQVRLKDTFGDNGMISVVIARPEEGQDVRRLVIDTWLMSCRVLGRKVEQEFLNCLVEKARSLDCSEIVGEYLPTEKNELVREHYSKLGFEPAVERDPKEMDRWWSLGVEGFKPFETPMTLHLLERSLK